MNWIEFLTDAELNDPEKFHRLPDGEYLFGKILHDVLDCLTIHRGYVEIITANNQAYPVPTINTVVEWDNITQDWYKQTLTLDEDFGKYESTSIEWARHIAEIGMIVQGVSNFQAEVKTITMPEAEEAKQLLQSIKRNAAALHLLWQDIQAQNYKRLWVTEKYQELISADDL